MATTFKPCVSRSACTEDGEHCRGCGRSHQEINAVRAQVTQLSEFIRLMEYDNPEDFLNWLQGKVLKRLEK
jgi:predicted Fe-S protein YdhL (DUF1289 family)